MSRIPIMGPDGKPVPLHIQVQIPIEGLFDDDLMKIVQQTQGAAGPICINVQMLRELKKLNQNRESA